MYLPGFNWTHLVLASTMRPIFLTPCQPRYRIFRIGLDDANITRCVLHDVILGVVEKMMPGRIDQLRKFGMSWKIFMVNVSTATRWESAVQFCWFTLALRDKYITIINYSKSTEHKSTYLYLPTLGGQNGSWVRSKSISPLCSFKWPGGFARAGVKSFHHPCVRHQWRSIGIPKIWMWKWETAKKNKQNTCCSRKTMIRLDI